MVGIVGGESGITKADGSLDLKTSVPLSQTITLHVQMTWFKLVDQTHPAGVGAATVVLSKDKSKRRQ
jgi:hypothetical protein